MRFGIGMNTDHTLEEVGQQFSVTRERIRQSSVFAPFTGRTAPNSSLFAIFVADRASRPLRNP